MSSDRNFTSLEKYGDSIKNIKDIGSTFDTIRNKRDRFEVLKMLGADKLRKMIISIDDITVCILNNLEEDNKYDFLELLGMDIVRDNIKKTKDLETFLKFFKKDRFSLIHLLGEKKLIEIIACYRDIHIIFQYLSDDERFAFLELLGKNKLNVISDEKFIKNDIGNILYELSNHRLAFLELLGTDMLARVFKRVRNITNIELSAEDKFTFITKDIGVEFFVDQGRIFGDKTIMDQMMRWLPAGEKYHSMRENFYESYLSCKMLPENARKALITQFTKDSAVATAVMEPTTIVKKQKLIRYDFVDDKEYPPQFSHSIQVPQELSKDQLEILHTLLASFPCASSYLVTWPKDFLALNVDTVPKDLLQIAANAYDQHGNTMLGVACEYGKEGAVEAIERLIAMGADLNMTDDGHHKLPLHWAITNKHSCHKPDSVEAAQVVQCLLNHDARTDITSYKDMTPLEYAEADDKGYTAAAKMIEDHMRKEQAKKLFIEPSIPIMQDIFPTKNKNSMDEKEEAKKVKLG